MAIDERALGVIDALYDAALDEKAWPEALKQLMGFTNSQAASFWVLDGSEQPRLPTFEYVNFDRAFIAEYLARVAPADPTVQYLVRHPEQPVVHDGHVIEEREKDRHAYYDWHARFSDTRFRLIGQARPAPSMQAGVALHRARSVGRFEGADIERFTFLYRHLERALAIGVRLGSVTALERCAHELLDQNPAAIVLLGADLRVVYANEQAVALAAEADGVSLSNERIALVRRSDDERLKRLVARALAARGSAGVAPGGALRVPRRSGKRAYTLQVAPVSRKIPALSAVQPAVCVVIADPDRAQPLDPDRVQAGLGLTASEARLVVHLVEGMTLRDAAAKLAITYGTARARLAEVFRKTDTRRQAELVKLAAQAMRPC